MELNKIYNMDCIAGMAMIPDKSVDMILSDLPYGITGCRWDSLIPFDQLWVQYKRVIKDNGAIVLTVAQPFTTQLIMSNKNMFRYCWYWKKNYSTGHAFAKYQSMRCIEDICVFYKKAPTYNPQGLIKRGKPSVCRGRTSAKHGDDIYDTATLSRDTISYYTNYPKNFLEVKGEHGLHPTQKPVELFRYMIETYTNPGELVLDSCIGSGTTAVAAVRTGRNYIGFEIDTQHYQTAVNRIERVKAEL